MPIVILIMLCSNDLGEAKERYPLLTILQAADGLASHALEEKHSSPSDK